jgi:transposase
MRGKDIQQSAMFSYVSPEERVPGDHPLRPIRSMVDVVLKGLSRSFGRLYVDWGRPSIAPEKLLRALRVQVLYSIRSERLLMEQLEYNLLFRWLVGLNMDEPVWVPTVFSKNRDRLLNGDIAEKFFAQVLKQARANNLLSDEHFSVDGTLIEAWASQKSFQRKDQDRRHHRRTLATRLLIFTAKSAATTRTLPRPIRKQSWHEKVEGTSRSWPIAATC